MLREEGEDMKKVTAYQCDFCKTPKLYLSRGGARKHEKRCWLNPIRKSCATCANLVEVLASKNDPMVETMNWHCTDRRVTPFKQKIDNCRHYGRGDGLFNDGQVEGKI